MSIQLLLLAFFTLAFWMWSFLLFSQRRRLGLLPFLINVAIATIFMEFTLALGVSVQVGDLFFLVASTVFFTAIMLSIFLGYVFDSAETGRSVILVKLFTTVIYASCMSILPSISSLPDQLVITGLVAFEYLWSNVAFFIDFVVLVFLWELLRNRASFLPNWIRTGVVFWIALLVDTLIFVPVVFGRSEYFWLILRGNSITRSFLAVFLSLAGIAFFKVEKSYGWKPLIQNFSSILNFQSSLEQQLSSAQNDLQAHKKLEAELLKERKKYELATKGSKAGMWDWDIVSGKQEWSDTFYRLLGFEPGEIESTAKEFGLRVHPDDAQATDLALSSHLKNKTPFAVEYRVKTKSGEYNWFLGSGQAEWNSAGVPIRMVGTIIDIQKQKAAEEQISKKVVELEKMNKYMVGRELKMRELKKQISQK